MDQSSILDIAHISFLQIVQSLIAQAGPASAKGTLMRMAINTAAKVDPQEFATFEDYVKSIESADNIITQIEGHAVHMGDGVFGLPKCPFADSIKNFMKVMGSMPEGYAELTAEFNRPGGAADKYRIGNGAGVSPFCAVHQTIRSALAERITIGGRPLKAYQLGCKAGSGVKAISDRWVEASNSDKSKVDKVLDDNMCCYRLLADE